MFTEQQAMFIYAVSPLHMGAGTTVGVIDNPIQREVHTGWPSMAGSGIKGAIRHALNGNWAKETLDAIFGPAADSGELHAGAISFTDAQIVCFPVRSLKAAYVYATCPTAIGRLGRLVGQSWSVPLFKDTEALINNSEILQDRRLILEALAYEQGEDKDQIVGKIADWLAQQAVPPGFFADKLKRDLVILSDSDFTHFVKNSTLVEPHVRIDDDTGTAKGGGLFYTENLPPESLLITLAMASQVRDAKTTKNASQVIQEVSAALNNGKIWQFGGDATTGRGLVMLRFAAAGGDNARKP